MIPGATVLGKLGYDIFGEFRELGTLVN